MIFFWGIHFFLNPTYQCFDRGLDLNGHYLPGAETYASTEHVALRGVEPFRCAMFLDVSIHPSNDHIALAGASTFTRVHLPK